MSHRTTLCSLMAAFTSILLIGLMGCSSPPSCENHKALDEAIANDDEHERARRQGMIEKSIRTQIELMKILDSVHPPVAKCKRCEEDIDRLLRVRLQ